MARACDYHLDNKMANFARTPVKPLAFRFCRSLEHQPVGLSQLCALARAARRRQSVSAAAPEERHHESRNDEAGNGADGKPNIVHCSRHVWDTKSNGGVAVQSNMTPQQVRRDCNLLLRVKPGNRVALTSDLHVS